MMDTALPSRIVRATEGDAPVLMQMIRALAEYEELAHELVATEDDLRESLFGKTPCAEAAIAYAGDVPAGFALWFQNYSTFLGRPGLHLEDLFVLPEWRRRGIGRLLLAYVARVAVAKQSGRLEWAVLNWNAPAIRIYEGAGARPLSDWTVYRLTGEALEALASEARDAHRG